MRLIATIADDDLRRTITSKIKAINFFLSIHQHADIKVIRSK